MYRSEMYYFPTMRSGARVLTGVALVGAAAIFSPGAQGHITYSSPFDTVGTGYAQVDRPIYMAVGASGRVFLAEGQGGSAAVLNAVAVDNAQLVDRRSESVAFVRRDGGLSLLLGGIGSAHNNAWMGRDILGGQPGAMPNRFGPEDGARVVTSGSVLQAAYTIYPSIHSASPLTRFRTPGIEWGSARSAQFETIELRSHTEAPDENARVLRFERSLSDNPTAGQALAENISTVAASTMLVEVGGLVPAGQHGHFAVAGSAALNAALEVIVGHRAHPSLQDDYSADDDRVATARDIFADSILPVHENRQTRVEPDNRPRPAPEPAGLGLAVAAAAGLLARRKR
jgi:MYXO-CTERM domain-containing protein